MKRTLLSALALVAVIIASAFPKALYVKQGDTYTKYNFGVAGDLKFSDGGKTLTITGYSEAINLDAIDYITFTAPVQESLTPSEQKAKMIAIGEEVNKRVDLYNVQDALRMVDCFTNGSKSNGWYPYCEYEVPQEYWDVHNEVGANAMRAAAGDVGAVAKLRAGAAKLYKFGDYTGIYNANSTTRSWERIAQADYFEMRFRAEDGDNYVVRLTPSEEFTTYTTPDYIGQLPRTIEILMTKGNTTIATGSIKSELKQDVSISINTDITCGKYNAAETMLIENDKITVDATVTVGGEKLATANSVVLGKNLLNYDEMRAAIDDARHWHDEDGNCQGEDFDALTSHFVRANTTADVLGLLQANVKGFAFNKIYNEFKDADDNPYNYLTLDNGKCVYTYGKIINQSADHSMFTVTQDDFAYYDKLGNYLNNYLDGTFYYDNKPEIQGYLYFEPSEESYDDTPWYDEGEPRYGFTVVDGFLVSVTRDQTWTDGQYTFGPWYYTAYTETYDDSENIEVAESQVYFPKLVTHTFYNLTPVLAFPDLTSFAFEDFFTEDSFKALINDYEDIISTYETIVGRDDD